MFNNIFSYNQYREYVTQQTHFYACTLKVKIGSWIAGTEIDRIEARYDECTLTFVKGCTVYTTHFEAVLVEVTPI